MRPLDLNGSRFGKLLVIGISPFRENGAIAWECKCDCGKLITTRGSRLKEGRVKSCGCLVSEKAKESITKYKSTHGQSRTRTYSSWQNMKNRCRSPNTTDFDDYGGRGIDYCERWGVFENFYGDMGDRPIGTTLDRVDVNGNYEPGNCRWADNETQSNNKRESVVYDYHGEKLTLQQICKRVGKARSTVAYRLKKNMSIEEALK